MYMKVLYLRIKRIQQLQEGGRRDATLRWRTEVLAEASA
jgi:hypothetical protein